MGPYTLLEAELVIPAPPLLPCVRSVMDMRLFPSGCEFLKGRGPDLTRLSASHRRFTEPFSSKCRMNEDAPEGDSGMEQVLGLGAETSPVGRQDHQVWTLRAQQPGAQGSSILLQLCLPRGW